MPVTKTIQEKALDVALELNPGSKDLKLLYSLPDFLDGELIVVSGVGENGKTFENQIYVSDRRVRLAKNASQFAHLVAEEAKRRTPIFELIHVGGIAGLIAVILTLTICYMFAVLKVTDVPAVLSTSLATILGFYFGTRAGKDKSDI